MAARFQINQVLARDPLACIASREHTGRYDGLKRKEFRKSAAKRAVFIQRVPELTRRDGI